MNEKLLITANYRPFTKNFYHAERFLSDRLTQNHYDIFGNNLDKENIYIGHIGNDTQKPFGILVGNGVSSLNYLSSASGCRIFPLYRYENGVRVENITDWALALFQKHYEKITSFSKDVIFGVIEKLDIFHYVYAVLHQPEYRQKYEQNLKREFPRVPLYADFWKYAQAGEKLMELHLNYESPQKITSLFRDVIFTPPLQRKDIDLEVFKARKQGKKKKIEQIEITSQKRDVISDAPFTVYPILKIRDNNIEIDELTTLLNVPATGFGV